MKKQIQSLLLIALLVGMAAPVWGQASTLGKEFWVSSTIVCSPEQGTPTPYIAISAEKACEVHIEGGVNNAINITQKVAAGSWNEFGNGTTKQTDPTQGLIKVPMDASAWYPVQITHANNVLNLAGAKNMYGLHITATEEISVYVILASPYSMDASNILPITAIQSEYYTQDHKPMADGHANVVTMATILATEDGTQVDIIPNGNTYDGHQSGTLYTVDLVKGQTYYLMSQVGQQLSGTHIQARNGKKIAVYNGVPLINLPNDIDARDCLFEQAMPVEYWGTQFIATRSLEKNGNLIGITASQRGTEIKVDGYSQAIINEGETYYIMLQGPSDPNGNKPGLSHIDLVATQDVAYIETSCPCAVYNYDTGRGYAGKNNSEVIGKNGDPSSVWVSPIQQKIGQITFGTCYTDKTENHFLNVVTETATCNDTKLTAMFGVNTLDKTNLLVWQPVPGNPAYSYARAKIGIKETKNYSVFRLQNPKGFIATVYGNGENESYAYSAGSAAVEQGVNVNGETYTDGYISNTTYCEGSEIQFDAKVGTDEISQVNWDFGDGTTEYHGEPQTSHIYDVPGWYDVAAELYGRQVCTDQSNNYLGTVHFSFYVTRPDTIYHRSFECQAEGYTGEMSRIDTKEYNCDSVVITLVEYGVETSSEYSHVAQDSYTLNGVTYDRSQDVTWTLPKANASGCDSTITCHLRIITCLDMEIPNNADNQHICPGDLFDIPYIYNKGDIGETHFICGTTNAIVTPNAGVISLPTDQLIPGIYNAQITVEDTICERTLTFPINLTVYYPSSVFAYKFNNVLAVYNNTGYNFTGYQWYHNGEPIVGATGSVYHSAEPFVLNDTYYVVLTRADGIVMPSCEKVIDHVDDYTVEQNNAPAVRKTLIDQHLYIERDGHIYNSYGVRVQ